MEIENMPNITEAAAKFAERMKSEQAEDAPRAPARPKLREDDPRARARQRAEELRQHGSNAANEAPDPLYVDPNDIPDGWSYEWKMFTVYGAENPAYQIELQRRGWTAVPRERHPHMMPLGSNEAFIMRDGPILMECPMEIVEERRAEELRAARQQVRSKEQQLAGTPDGTMTRDHVKVRPQIKKSYEAMPIPEE
jgi:hypothetical protein